VGKVTDWRGMGLSPLLPRPKLFDRSVAFFPGDSTVSGRETIYYGPRITDVTTNLVVLYVRGREVAPQLDEADIMTVKAMYLL
jgi:hypothetical protein